jgi:hypothetical protein
MQRILLVCLLFASSLIEGATDENAYRQWRTALFDALAQTKDANDYLALYLLSGHESASDGLAPTPRVAATRRCCGRSRSHRSVQPNASSLRRRRAI